MTQDPAPEKTLLLKWGTVKGWSNLSETDVKLLQQWADLGISASCMMQKNAPEQRELLVQFIEQFDGTIYNDWDGREYSKADAIHYIRSYGHDVS